MSKTALPPYSGQNCVCAACGYCNRKFIELPRFDTRHHDGHLIRICPRCGYTWDEACTGDVGTQPTSCPQPAGDDALAKLKARVLKGLEDMAVQGYDFSLEHIRVNTGDWKRLTQARQALHRELTDGFDPDKYVLLDKARVLKLVPDHIEGVGLLAGDEPVWVSSSVLRRWANGCNALRRELGAEDA